ncbi:male sterility family protein [Mycobacterium kansasii 662]|uniref:Male sterility family protein n=1 Tax=Mycobacterium kansasii 662 TaxID=1299326 RepID=X7XNW9_MYCKA|nr:male sterility family protein [Mycobacterium kansasii 662]
MGVIVSPASDLAAIAAYIEGERQGSKRPTFAVIHGRDALEVHASDLTLDKFIDASTLAAAPVLPPPSAAVRTVLLTGATGFLGRYLALDWLERMDLVRRQGDRPGGGEVGRRCPGTPGQDVRQRRPRAADPLPAAGDRPLGGHRRDKGEANLGLDQLTWQRLADTVRPDRRPGRVGQPRAALQRAVRPNALGTAELIRIALTGKLKPYTYVSTIGVGDQIEPGKFTEDADIRHISATRKINDSYANGYGNSKWAGRGGLLRGATTCAGCRSRCSAAT